VIHNFESALNVKNSQKELNHSAADMFYPYRYNCRKNSNTIFPSSGMIEHFYINISIINQH